MGCGVSLEVLSIMGEGPSYGDHTMENHIWLKDEKKTSKRDGVLNVHSIIIHNSPKVQTAPHVHHLMSGETKHGISTQQNIIEP